MAIARDQYLLPPLSAIYVCVDHDSDIQPGEGVRLVRVSSCVDEFWGIDTYGGGRHYSQKSVLGGNTRSYHAAHEETESKIHSYELESDRVVIFGLGISFHVSEQVHSQEVIASTDFTCSDGMDYSLVSSTSGIYRITKDDAS